MDYETKRIELVEQLRGMTYERRREVEDYILGMFRAAEVNPRARRKGRTTAARVAKQTMKADIEAREIWQRVVDRSRKGKARRRGKG